MLNPFNPQNPDRLQKSIGDLQTAIEMNDVIGAFKANALVLQNLISKINPELVLSTDSQIISNAINELKQQLDSFIGFNISEKSLTNGQSFLFPAMSKGEAFVIRIFEYDGSSQEGIPSPNGVVWLGGYGGVGVGDGSMVICLVNNAGGTYNDVGHNFAIINQGKDSEVIFVDELPDENLARTGVIYVLNSNNAMYVWDQQLGDYVLVGDVIPGTLISSTEFIDENNNEVIPEADRLYFDTTSEIYYRWDGSGYVLLNQTDNELVFYTEELAAQGEEGKLYISILTGEMKIWTSGAWLGLTFNLHTEDSEIAFKGDGTLANPLSAEIAIGHKIPYKAIDTSTTPPDLAQLTAHGTDRVDFPNLNRIYYLNGAKWTYVETNDI